MPRSKREKEVSLTKVKKKTKETKEKLVDDLRNAVDNYENLFVYSVENMRATKFIENNVMAIALGRQKSDEYVNGLHKISQLLKGQCGLMFTNVSRDEVIEYFRNLHESDYARAGDIATETIELPAGPLTQFPFSIEPQLRKLGLPTKLEKGVVTLYEDFTVCTEEDTLSPEQAKILKLLDRKLADFHVVLKASWNKQKGLQDVVC